MRTAKWWMLAVTCLSVIVVSLDLTVLNIALPSISAALHASTADLQWIVDGYSLAFAGVMLSAGVIGDRVGRRRVLLAGLVVFLAASVWCALSASVGGLIAGRVLMGLGAATVFPLSLAITSAAFSDAERPRAIGILTAAVALGLPLGPVLGGVLLQHFAWNSVFWINVPAVCLTLAAGFFLVPESRNPAAPPLDVPGALLSAAAVTSLVWGVINGPEHGWASPANLGAAGRRRSCSPPSVSASGGPRARSSTRRCSGTRGSPGAPSPPSASPWRCSGSCSRFRSTSRACSAMILSARACGCCR